MPVWMFPVGESFKFYFNSLSDDTYNSYFTIEAHKDVNDANDNPFGIDHVIFNGPATIVFWVDNTKTVVKCAEDDAYNERTAIIWAIMKKAYGNSSRANKALDKLIKDAGCQEIENNEYFLDIDNYVNAFHKSLAGLLTQ